MRLRLDRVCRRSRGDLSADLERVLAAVRTGEPVTLAFDALAARSGVPVVARFAQGVAVAVAPRWPTCCMPKRPTSGRPRAAS